MNSYTQYLFFIPLILFMGCDIWDRPDYHTQKYCAIFKFNNEEYADYVMTLGDYVGGSVFHPDTGLYFLNWDNPMVYFQSDTSNICEFAMTPKLIQLHDGYYLWHPYSSFGDYQNVKLRDLRWSDLCSAEKERLFYYQIDVDNETNKMLCLSDSVPKLGGCGTIYKEYYRINGYSLWHFGHKRPEKMTFDDIIKTCNKIIDKGKQYDEKYCFNPFNH